MRLSPENRIAAIAAALRALLEGPIDAHGARFPGDLEQRLASLGLAKGSPVAPADALPALSPDDHAARRFASAYLDRRASIGVDHDTALGELIGEASFAWFLRLVTRRCLRARGLRGELPSSISPLRPALALRPSEQALRRCEELLAHAPPDEADPFLLKDALGWAYQAWNDEEKSHVFEAIRVKSLAKIGGRDLIPATCIYTQSHHVKLLLQCSLGARWRADHPSSRLHEGWDFHVDGAAPPPSPPRSARALSVLDPACGSGHFLLEAFDLLAAMYRDEGEIREPALICAAIFEHNLHGIDIDERAVEIALISLVLRAREIAPDFVPRAHHLVATSLCLAPPRELLARFLAAHPDDAPRSAAIEPLFGVFSRARELGSLLRLDAPIDGALLDRVARHLDAEDADRAALSLAPTSDHARASRLLALLARRYAVVCMNPPYVGFRKLASHLKEPLAEDELATLDLYVAFLSRGFSLLERGGALAAITPSSWTTSSRTAKLRARMLAEGGPRLVVSLGQRVFEAAPLLFVSLAVIDRGHHAEGGALFTLRPPPFSGEEGLRETVTHTGKRWPHALIATLPTSPFFPVAPLALLERARDQPCVQDFFSFVDGVWTGSNDRDFREAWEVAPDDPAWIPTSGGQGYARWWAPFARRMRARDGEAWAARSARSFALEYSRVAGGKLAARLVQSPSVAIAGTVTLLPRPGVDRARLYEAAAVFNCRLGTIWLRTLTSGLNFNPGYAGRIPLAVEPPSQALQQAVEKLVAHKRSLAALDLACDDFTPDRFAAGARASIGAWADRRADERLDIHALALDDEAEIEELLREHLAIDDASWADLEAELGKPVALLPKAPALDEGREPAGEAIAGDATEETEDGGDDVRALPAESELEALARASGRCPRSLLSSNDLPRPIASQIGALRERLALSALHDYLCFTLLRLFGHRWPADGAATIAGAAPPLVPLLSSPGEPTLLDLLKGELTRGLAAAQADAWMGELEHRLGKPLVHWLELDFFRVELGRLRRRPMLVQIQSGTLSATRRPHFACVINAHRLDAELFTLLRERHLARRREELERSRSAPPRSTEGRASRGARASARAIEASLRELDELDRRLDALLTLGFDTPQLPSLLAGEPLDRWTSRDGRAPPPASREAFLAEERRYLPARDDGVRVNLAPLQRAGLLAADVLAPNDLAPALADRARWRAEERRLCREGKLDRPSYWPRSRPSA
jgi:SAM-dependent methyltransferase